MMIKAENPDIGGNDVTERIDKIKDRIDTESWE